MKAQAIQVYKWQCPYKDCCGYNETENLEQLKSGKFGADCYFCSRTVNLSE